MAGSIARRLYVSDAGISYSIKIDESNARATPFAGTNPLCPALTANAPGTPAGFSRRYILCFALNQPRIRRRFFVGDPGLISTLTQPGATLASEVFPGSGDTAGTPVTWVITAYRGEKQEVVPAAGSPDTGLIDGTP